MHKSSHLLWAAAIAATALSGPAAAQEATTTVTLVHAIPGTAFDIQLDGDPLLDDFEPGTVAEPVELPAGEHVMDVTSADDKAALLLSNLVTLELDTDMTVVAHLGEGGEPTTTLFVNDVSPTAEGRARTTVRHVAAAPPVDVLADDEPVARDLASGQEVVATVAPGAALALATAGGNEVLIELDAAPAPGTNTILYVLGRADDPPLDVVVQTIGDLGEGPNEVPAGSGGLVGERRATVPAVVLGLVGVVAIGLAIRRPTPATGPR